MFCKTGYGTFKQFMGYHIHIPSSKPPSSAKKDWRELKMFNEITKEDMKKLEKLMRNWTLYETGWYISSSASLYDSLFIWLTEHINQPYDVDIVYKYMFPKKK